MRYEEILDEGIEDKGIFKAVFFAGLPGSGKTTVAQKITDGTVQPRMVNSDKSFEFLANKAGMASSNVAWALLGPRASAISAQLLLNYLNGMLPLFVDGTSANPSSLLRRSGIIESLGYDTMMVWVNTSLDTAITRAEKRERHVDEKYIREVFSVSEKNKQFYKQRFSNNFIEVDNNGDTFDAMEIQTYNVANKFFTSPISNPIGVRTELQMREAGDKYLIPTIYSEEYLSKIVDMWFVS